MDRITFIIWPVGEDMCRIEASDCRAFIRNFSDGACITSINVLIAEMSHISEKCRQHGFVAQFEMGRNITERSNIV